eukprot:scaffold31299_cov107-Isochrysis_galbana.AAC.2
MPSPHPHPTPSLVVSKYTPSFHPLTRHWYASASTIRLLPPALGGDAAPPPRHLPIHPCASCRSGVRACGGGPARSLRRPLRGGWVASTLPDAQGSRRFGTFSPRPRAVGQGGGRAKQGRPAGVQGMVGRNRQLPRWFRPRVPYSAPALSHLPADCSPTPAAPGLVARAHCAAPLTFLLPRRPPPSGRPRPDD